MSIVEKAIAKLQATRRAAEGVRARPLPPTTIVGRVVEHRAPDAPRVHDGRRREQVGNPAKRLRIDYDALRLNGLLPPEHQERELAQQYRNLKRPLLRHAFQPEADAPPDRMSQRLIMITSALPGEGKTFTAINLAISLSMERDHSVLLVDGDVPKPNISHLFGVVNEPGLLDLVSDTSLPIETAVLATSVPGLSILPVGRQAESPTELFASARMREVMSQLEQLDPQGIVLMDSPPVLLTSEARVLSSLFGQVLVVVQASSTPQQAVLEALQIVGDNPRIGLVLNQTTHGEFEGRQYGYGYGYEYGYGYGKSGEAAGNREKHP
jgi:exopolysaccharide/PEP-CTERM locus tyrosine autokinase